MSTEQAVEQKPDMIHEAKVLVDTFYWHLYQKKFGAHFHAFLEWVGVMNVYLDMVKQTGADPMTLNKHSRVEASIADHQLMYLGEKLSCILAPVLRTATDEDKRRFVDMLVNGK